jgi:hypothetical protein
MSVNAAIAQGFRGIELQNPLDAYTRVNQLQQAQQQNQLNALKMQDYQREAESENRLRALYARPGVNTQSPEFLQEVYAVSPSKGAAMQKSALEVQKSQRESDKAAADIAATRMKMARDLLPSVTSPEAYANWRSYTLQNLPGLSNVIPEQYSPETTRNLMLEADKALEQHFVTQNMGGAQQVIGMPKYGGGAAAVVPGSYAAAVPKPAAVQAQEEAARRAGASNISLSTEKKYGEAFAGNIAKVDIDKMTTAEGAPALAESANRIIGLVQQGNVLTGPIADVKLNIARALNVAGADNAEKIANTESLIAATGQSTLNAIKGAGLGAGQGFTDKDLKFLQDVAGGTINLTPQTLTELASLQHRVATKAAESWNRRRQEIPKDVVQGTGLSMTPITVPPLMQKSAPAAARPKGVGAEWTLMTDKNGAKAWVSPDRKQLVEVP